jgi:hypothetical protein
MSARVNASQVAYLPSADEAFLKNALATLEQLREESELHGRHLLASLLAITKGEAEDDLKTCSKKVRGGARMSDHDDGAAMLARKFAYRSGEPEKVSA